MRETSASIVGVLPQSPQRLYARMWRWHFFAALIVIPFALWRSPACSTSGIAS